jgi:NitT/TauT family transport system substrate-binding protein
MPITLQENLRGLLYAPYYAALALGAYRQEGIEISFVSAPAPAQATVGLFAGTVDVAWAGRCGSCRCMRAGPTATSSASAKW